MSYSSANYPEDIVAGLPPGLESGVYYGWACVENGEVYKMVMSVGWNPHFNNTERSMVVAQTHTHTHTRARAHTHTT